MKKPCELVVIAYILACMSQEFGIFMPKHLAVQRLLNSYYKFYNYNL